MVEGALFEARDGLKEDVERQVELSLPGPHTTVVVVVGVVVAAVSLTSVCSFLDQVIYQSPR